MKFLYSFLLILIFSFTSIASADENINKVFKIESYELNKLTNSYDLSQYGSAVYIDKNIIFTNAHVVLNEDNEPIGNYRVCKTENFKNIPECFSLGQLLYYDVENDLAALRIVDPKVSTVKKSTSEIKIGDTINVYGYPNNGGETITFTSGKISGYEKGLYKIDANIDSGNSGGGAFDSDGNLLGIVVSVRVGYTAIGYIIPLSKISDFESKKNKLNIKEYSGTINTSFFRFHLKLSQALSSNSFKNRFLELKSINKYGFNLERYFFSNDDKYFMSLFSSQDNKTNISIFNTKVYFPLNEKYNNIFDYYENEVNSKEIDDDIFIERNNSIKFQNRDTYIDFTLYKDDSAYISFAIQNKEEHIVIVLYTENINSKSFLNGLKLIVKDLNILDFEEKSYNKKNKVFDLYIDKLDSYSLITSGWFNEFEFLSDDIELSFNAKVDKKSLYKLSLSEYAKSGYNSLSNYAMLNYYGILETNYGLNYIYQVGINNEYKSGAKYEDEKRYFINAYFYTNIDDSIVRSSFSFTFDKKESKEVIEKFLKSISTEKLEPAIEIGDLKVGENLVENVDFDL